MPGNPEDHLAPYAVRSADARGRRHEEPNDPLRGPFQVDRRRIVESTAFRRLEGKTQVFAPSRHDHFRTRLTHTLEAVQIARTLASALAANETLAEAITLAHDLGHPPFGHAGEAALNQAMGGDFNHNAHSLRVVDYLEHPFPPFRGLNLTLETLAGLGAHQTRYDAPAQCNAENGTSVEAQIASVADRIAYDHHDLEDAIGAGLVGPDELLDVAMWRDAFERTSLQHGPAHIHGIRRVVLNVMMDAALADVVDASVARLATVGSAAEIAGCGKPHVAPSPEMDARLGQFEAFLMERVYRRPEVAASDAEGQRMILALFKVFRLDPSLLPSRFQARVDEQGLARVIGDYVAGMTDRFCRDEWARLCTS